MQKTLSTTAMILSGLFGMIGGSVQAQDIQAQRLYHQALAATCANCHGTNGVSVPDVTIPKINQLSESVMYERLMEYKSGKREGTIMPQLAKGYTEEQLKIVANVLGKKN